MGSFLEPAYFGVHRSLQCSFLCKVYSVGGRCFCSVHFCAQFKKCDRSVFLFSCALNLDSFVYG